MSNTSQILVNIIKDISEKQTRLAEYAQIVDAEVVALINPFTKEYSVKIRGTQVTAYGLYDQIYNPADIVRIIDTGSDKYIVSKSTIIEPPEADPRWDQYDLLGPRINLLTQSYEDLEGQIQKAKNPYCRIGVDIWVDPEEYIENADFESTLTITFEETDSKGENLKITYSTNDMVGSLQAGTSHAADTVFQTSSYLPIDHRARTVESVLIEVPIINKNELITWNNVFIEIYDKVSEADSSGLKVITPNGDSTSSEGDVLTLEAKMREDYMSVDEEGVEYIWFRRNPLVTEGHEKYDARAGEGWERIEPDTEQEQAT